MKRLASVLLLAAAPHAGAAERPVDEESVRSKVLAAAAQAEQAHRATAPFRAVHDPIPDWFSRVEAPARKSRGSCDAHARALCYDASERRIVYRPARELMPEIDGMRAESLSLRHGRLTFKYSFR